MEDKIKKRNSKFLYIVAFVSGMVIMAVEMSASRLLAPHFGTSIFVWTNVIGLVMIALALGYYFGGKISDRNPEKGLLMKIILVASILILIIPLLINPVADLTTINIFKANVSSVIILIGSFFSTLLLFVLPVLLLGMVSPFTIKLLSLTNNNVGKVSGSVFAFSTLGSIFGTFLSTIALIPLIGTKRTIFVSALLLLLVSSIGLIKKNKKYLLLFFIFLPILFLNIFSVKKDANALYETESSYQYIEVIEETDGTKYLYYNAGLGINSVHNPNKNITGYYYDYYNLLPEIIAKKDLDVLIIGFAGGTIANQLSNYFPEKNINIDGVEIDDKVIEVSKKYFDTDGKGFNIYNDEGRMFLKQSEKKYDLIIIDAYNNQLHIPFHLTTEEFFKLASDKLSADGIVAINVNAESRESKLLRAISNSIAKNFDQVVIAPVDYSFNYMIVGGNREVDLKKIEPSDIHQDLSPILQYVKRKSYLYNYDNSVIKLTDDRAPIEYFTDRMIFEYLRK